MIPARIFSRLLATSCSAFTSWLSTEIESVNIVFGIMFLERNDCGLNLRAWPWCDMHRESQSGKSVRCPRVSAGGNHLTSEQHLSASCFQLHGTKYSYLTLVICPRIIVQSHHSPHKQDILKAYFQSTVCSGLACHLSLQCLLVAEGARD